MKTFVYIDGENVFYQMVDILVKAGRIKKRDDLKRIDLQWLFCEAIDLNEKPRSLRYYGTKLRLVKDLGKPAYNKSLRMIQHKRAWGSWLHDQGIEFVTAGNLKPRQNGRAITFQEKGVDVRLAVDVVQDACYGHKLHVVVVSSDSDLVPAVRAVRQQKQKISYVAFSESINGALALTASQTLTFTRKKVIEAFDRVNKKIGNGK